MALISSNKYLLLKVIESIYRLEDILDELHSHGLSDQVTNEAEVIVHLYADALMHEGDQNPV